jgi:hypothetical protein
MNPSEALAVQRLQTHPMDFLRSCSVTPHGVSDTGVKTFYMIETILPGRPGGNVNPQQQFKILPEKDVLDPNAGFPFHVVHIPVQPSNIAINPYSLPLHGPGIMITTQLTGCCIVMIPARGTWDVAHLQPKGETGEQLRIRLAKSGLKVYGAPDYSGYRAVFIGIRIKSIWEFYTQKQNASFNVVSVSKL